MSKRVSIVKKYAENLFFQTSFDNVITFYWQFEYRVKWWSLPLLLCDEGLCVMMMMVTGDQGSGGMMGPGNIPRPPVTSGPGSTEQRPAPAPRIVTE